MLQYRLGSGSRISVYVYDPRRIPTQVTRLHARMVSGEPDPVYIGHVRGWSIAAAERRGVGVAIASDLDDDESAELALAAARTETASFQAIGRHTASPVESQNCRDLTRHSLTSQ